MTSNNIPIQNHFFKNGYIKSSNSMFNGDSTFDRESTVFGDRTVRWRKNLIRIHNQTINNIVIVLLHLKRHIFIQWIVHLNTWTCILEIKNILWVEFRTRNTFNSDITFNRDIAMFVDCTVRLIEKFVIF